MLIGFLSCSNNNVNPGAPGDSDVTTLSPQATATPETTADPSDATGADVETSAPEATTGPEDLFCGIVVTSSDGSEIQPKYINGVATFILEDGTFYVSGKSTKEIQLVCRGRSAAVGLNGVEIHNKLVTPVTFSAVYGVLDLLRDSIISYEYEPSSDSENQPAPCVSASSDCQQLQIVSDDKNAKLEISSAFGSAIEGRSSIIIRGINLVLKSRYDCVTCMGDAISITDSNISFDAGRYGFYAHKGDGETIKGDSVIHFFDSNNVTGEFAVGGFVADAVVSFWGNYSVVAIKAKENTAASTAIMAYDAVRIEGGTIKLSADYGILSTAGASMKVDNTVLKSAGKVDISRGKIEISAADSCIDCKDLIVTGGTVVLGGSGDGIKAETVNMENGEMTIDVSGHSIFPGADVKTSGGRIKGYTP